MLNGGFYFEVGAGEGEGGRNTVREGKKSWERERGRRAGQLLRGQALDRLLISKTSVFYASLKNMTGLLILCFFTK